MMLIFLILVGVFRLSISESCLDVPSYYHYIKFITVEEGDSLKLKCYDDGYPYLPIKWYTDSTRRNFTLPNGESSCECGNVLELTSITKNQRGNYFCRTENLMLSISRYFQVKVNFIPSLLEMRRVDHVKSKKFELSVDIEAYPPPEILWMKENLLLYSDKQYQIIFNDTCNDVYNSTLIISTEFDYYGIYVCRITNQVGQLVVTFVVSTSSLKTNLPSSYDGSKGP